LHVRGIQSAELDLFRGQDSSTVENALYSDEGVLEAAAVGVPHETLGEVVAAVVSLKPGFIDKVTEASLIKAARKMSVIPCVFMISLVD